MSAGSEIPLEPIEALAWQVSRELHRAVLKFGPFNSPHEGWAVIREEMDELWEHVRGDTGTGILARGEALQVAAMALRYVLDLCGDPLTGTSATGSVSLPPNQDQRSGRATHEATE